jgi:hypothetical protein
MNPIKIPSPIAICVQRGRHDLNIIFGVPALKRPPSRAGHARGSSGTSAQMDPKIQKLVPFLFMSQEFYCLEVIRAVEMICE